MDDRRRYQRLNTPLDGTWRGQSGASPCRITDLSWSGCFIQTLSAPAMHARTVVTVTIGELKVDFAGKVVYVEQALGFAVEFDKLTTDQIEALTGLLGKPPSSVR
jgi:hypothetical protein